MVKVKDHEVFQWACANRHLSIVHEIYHWLDTEVEKKDMIRSGNYKAFIHGKLYQTHGVHTTF